MTDGLIQEKDPHRLIDHALPQNASLKSRVAITAAIRNPHATRKAIADFCGVTSSCVNDATLAFYRGTLELRGRTTEQSSGGFSVSVPMDASEFTAKQRAVIEFAARYPKCPREFEEWTWNDVTAYISEEWNIEMTRSYPAQVIADHHEFIKKFRKQLANEGLLPEDEHPMKPEDQPETIEGRIMRRAEIPDENMDDLDHPEETWVEPYREPDLDSVDENEMPHTDTDTESSTESTAASTDDGDGTDAALDDVWGDGPDGGIDARTERATRLSELATKTTGEKPSSIEVAVPGPLRRKLEKEVKRGNYGSPAEALVDYAISQDGIQEVIVEEAGDGPDTGELESEIEELSSQVETYQLALGSLHKRIEGFREVLEGEFELHENEHTAARLNTIQWVQRTLNAEDPEREEEN